jgi:hypothetical protein
MSKKVLTGALAAFACAAVVGAQAPPPAQPPAPNTPPSSAPAPRPQDQAAPRPQDQKSASADNLIVMGCLERGTASAAATPGPAGAAGGGAPGGAAGGAPAGAQARSDAPSFILTKVMRPTGTAGSSSAATAPSSYRLDADDSKLSSHVGEKVEITGKLDARSDSPGASRAAADSPRLKVDSVKMIAKTCTE